MNARALLVDGFETAAATQAASWARSAGVPVIADLDETYPGVEDLIANVDYLIVSRDFPARLTGERNLEQALRAAMKRFGCAITAATLGADGVLAWDGKRFPYAVPPIACRLSTPPAPATFFTPASSTAFCRIGRSIGNSILPAPPPRSTAPAPALAAASAT